jgi:Tol biopolymer transport system component
MAGAAGLLLAIAALTAGAGSAAASLPDQRGYEMVSPPAKNGADVILQSYKTFAASSGDGVAYPALGAFGDVRGTSTDVQYLSRRTGQAGTNGWSTHAINPLGAAPTLLPLFFSNVPTFEAGFSPDLTAAIFKSWRPLTDAPNVADVTNLYRINDLDARAPVPQLLTGSAAPLAAVDPILRLLLINAYDAASRDLRHVIFQSPWNLTSDGGFGFPGNLYENTDGIGLRTVGRIPTGTATECDDSGGTPCTDAPGAQAGISALIQSGQASGYSDGMISDDGSRILFQVPSGAIYLRENGTRTYQLNASEKTTPETPGTAQPWAMSADGTRVFFTTDEGLVNGDDDALPDLYMYDLTAPAGSRLTLVSVDRTGGTPFVSKVFGASADGHYVYFISDGQLVPGEPSDVLRGLYMWHDGTIAYIGRFENENETTRNTPRTVWTLFTQTRTSRVTPDGRFLLFMSQSDDGFRGRGGYAGYDHGSCDYGGAAPCRELFLYSADSGRLACVSCNPRSRVATGDALTDVHAGASGSAPTQHLSHAISDDGQHVFFNTQEALVPEDSNGKWDAYEYDVPSGTVHLISSGKDPADSYFLDASPNGHDVFFATRERLVGWDTDQNYDLYDARISGGLPEPTPVPPPCAGETCRAPANTAPTATSGASTQFKGTGDTTPHLRAHHTRCKGKTVLKRIRGKRKCIKPKTRTHAHRAQTQHKRSTR